MRNLLIVAISFAAFTNSADDWPQFRGPNGNGVEHGSGHPARWSNSRNIAWSAEIPGGGWSSPVVIGDKLFITTAVSAEGAKPKGFGEGIASMRGFSQAEPPQSPISFEVHCLKLSDGEPIWKKDNRRGSR